MPSRLSWGTLMVFRTMTRHGRAVRRAALAAATAGLTAVGVVTLPLVAYADPAAPPAVDAPVEPAIMAGVELLTPVTEVTAGSCTANFVFTSGDRVFIGSAAHCGTLGTATDLNGCTTESVPLGTPVIIRGADGTDYTGELAYSSWIAMQAAGETDSDLCELNDFALVAIDPADVSRVDSSVPVFGGPQGLDADGVAPRERIYSYQNAADDNGLPVMRAKQGQNLREAAGGRSHIVSTTTPGFAGDSGSGYLDAEGRAFGLLSTIIEQDGQVFNGVTDLAMALDYAVANSDLGDVALMNGTKPFSLEDVPTEPLPDVPDESVPAPGETNPLLPVLSR